jgi:hypothetical protein
MDTFIFTQMCLNLISILLKYYCAVLKTSTNNMQIKFKHICGKIKVSIKSMDKIDISMTKYI